MVTVALFPAMSALGTGVEPAAGFTAVMLEDAVCWLLAVVPPQATSSEAVAVLVARPNQSVRKPRRVIFILEFPFIVLQIGVFFYRWQNSDS